MKLSQVRLTFKQCGSVWFQAITVLSSSKISLSSSWFLYNSKGFCTSYFKESRFFYSTYTDAHFKAHIFSYLTLRINEVGSCPLRELGAAKKIHNLRCLLSTKHNYHPPENGQTGRTDDSHPSVVCWRHQKHCCLIQEVSYNVLVHPLTTRTLSRAAKNSC